MQVTPKSEKQIIEDNLLPKGVYAFEVASADDRVSSKQNEMIVLGLRLFDAEGDSRGFITDYLLDKIPHKVRHASVACGLLEKYEAGTLMASDFMNKMGEVKVGIQKSKDAQYPDKNVVADYVVKKDGEAATAQPIDDDIPF